MNVHLSPKLKGRLDRLLEQTNAESLTEVLRDCIAWYSEAVALEAEGGRLQVKHPGGEVETIRMVPGR